MNFYDINTLANPMVDVRFARSSHCAGAGIDVLSGARYFTVAGGRSQGYCFTCFMRSIYAQRTCLLSCCPSPHRRIISHSHLRCRDNSAAGSIEVVEVFNATSPPVLMSTVHYFSDISASDRCLCASAGGAGWIMVAGGLAYVSLCLIRCFAAQLTLLQTRHDHSIGRSSAAQPHDQHHLALARFSVASSFSRQSCGLSKLFHRIWRPVRVALCLFMPVTRSLTLSHPAFAVPLKVLSPLAT